MTPEWLVGGGAFYQNDTFVNTTNTAYVPDYWRFDVMTSYKVDQDHTIQLNIYNLTDEKYYAQYYPGATPCRPPAATPLCPGARGGLTTSPASAMIGGCGHFYAARLGIFLCLH